MRWANSVDNKWRMCFSFFSQKIVLTEPDYYQNVGADDDVDYDENGYDDYDNVDDDLNALIMLLWL